MPITPTFRFLALLLCLGFPGLYGAAQAEESVSNFDVTLVVEGKRVGSTWINLSAGGTHIEIPAAPVLNALGPLLDKSSVAKIESQVSATGTVSNRVLSRFGVSLSINGPQKTVMLGLAKNQPSPAAGKRTSDSVITARPVVKDDSGPWATPPMPALPGNVKDSLDSVFTIHRKPPPAKAAGDTARIVISDSGWVPVGSDSTPSTSAAMAPGGGPNVQLQSFRLDKTRDELFEEVFKRKAPPLPPSVEVTLLVDGKSYGTLWLQYNKEQKRYTFPVDPVLNALQGLVRPELFEKLMHRASRQSRFTVEDLIESGFPTVLNTSVFELSTGVPAQLLGTKTHSLTQRKIDPNTVPALEPSRLSAYVNTKINQQVSYYQYNRTPADSFGFGSRTVDARNKQPRAPILSNFDAAVNAFGWVVEGKGNVYERAGNKGFDANRQDIRLVHDWPRKSLRLTAGDLIFPTSGFQSFLKMGGIGLSRDFSLQPHLVAYPVKELEFFLSNTSEVKIYVNGILKTTVEMAPGTHDLQGFPFTRGESEVEVQIRDELGQTQTLNFSFIHEPSLLAKGNSVFSFNVGLPSRDLRRRTGPPADPEKIEILNYEYDPEHPTLFLDYRRGLSEHLTMEGYTQATDTAGIAGLNALYALRIGKISADVAGSYMGENIIDWAGNLEYTYIPKTIPRASPISWRVRAEYFGERFFRPGQDSSRLGSLTVASSLQKNGKLANMNLGMSYSFRPDKTDFYNIYTGLGKSWRKGFSMNMTLKNTYDRARRTNTSVSATVTYYLFADQQSVRASQRVENHQPVGNEVESESNWDYTTDLAWDYNGSAPFPQNPAVAASSSFGPSSNEYNGSAEWKGNQGVVQVLARRTEPKNSTIFTNHADLYLQTSLVYVDGNLAFSRPIANSFVLFKGVENEKDCQIHMNPSEVGYDAKSTPWLPGVMPSLNPYYLRKVHLDVKDPPFGAGDERTDFTLYPGYKNGYAIYMGTSATIIALGTLLLGPNQPVQYQTFTATPLEGKTREPVMGFTNGAGKFQLTRLQPGRYKIELESDKKEYFLILTLPKKTSGIKSVGTLLLKPE